jgi:hypothetical protein
MDSKDKKEERQAQRNKSGNEKAKERRRNKGNNDVKVKGKVVPMLIS